MGIEHRNSINSGVVWKSVHFNAISIGRTGRRRESKTADMCQAFCKSVVVAKVQSWVVKDEFGNSVLVSMIYEYQD